MWLAEEEGRAPGLQAISGEARREPHGAPSGGEARAGSAHPAGPSFKQPLLRCSASEALHTAWGCVLSSKQIVCNLLFQVLPQDLKSLVVLITTVIHTS